MLHKPSAGQYVNLHNTCIIPSRLLHNSQHRSEGLFWKEMLEIEDICSLAVDYFSFSNFLKLRGKQKIWQKH